MITASELHQQCIRTASELHQECIGTAQELQQICITTATVVLCCVMLCCVVLCCGTSAVSVCKGRAQEYGKRIWVFFLRPRLALPSRQSTLIVLLPPTRPTPPSHFYGATGRSAGYGANRAQGGWKLSPKHTVQPRFNFRLQGIPLRQFFCLFPPTHPRRPHPILVGSAAHRPTPRNV